MRWNSSEVQFKEICFQSCLWACCSKTQNHHQLSPTPPPFKLQQLYHKTHIHKTSQTLFSEVFILCACTRDGNHVLLLGVFRLFSCRKANICFPSDLFWSNKVHSFSRRRSSPVFTSAEWGHRARRVNLSGPPPRFPRAGHEIRLLHFSLKKPKKL